MIPAVDPAKHHAVVELVEQCLREGFTEHWIPGPGHRTAITEACSRWKKADGLQVRPDTLTHGLQRRHGASSRLHRGLRQQGRLDLALRRLQRDPLGRPCAVLVL